MAAVAQRSYWRLGRRGLHLMAASFSNFPEDPNRREENDMSKCFESIVTSVAALSALTFVAIATPASAHTYEYCRRDVIGNVLSCSFDTLAQCQAISLGRGGDCLRDPSLSDIGSTYAYAPDRRVNAQTRKR
jgi:uncharacterized protein DUF3551